MKFGIYTIVATAIGFPVALFASPAAALVLTLDDTVNSPLVVTDNGPGDTSPQSGDVSFNGAYGNWSSNTTTGLSQEILAEVEMDLNSVNVSSTSPATLVLTLEDDGFNSKGDVATFAALIGGTTNGIVTTETFFDATNTVGSLGTLMSNSGPFTGAFSDTVFTGEFDTSSSFGLGIRITIEHSEAQQVTSFNHNLVEVSEPATLGLMGLGLVGAGLFARRRQSKF